MIAEKLSSEGYMSSSTENDETKALVDKKVTKCGSGEGFANMTTGKSSVGAVLESEE